MWQSESNAYKNCLLKKSGKKRDMMMSGNRSARSNMETGCDCNRESRHVEMIIKQNEKNKLYVGMDVWVVCRGWYVQ